MRMRHSITVYNVYVSAFIYGSVLSAFTWWRAIGCMCASVPSACEGCSTVHVDPGHDLGRFGYMYPSHMFRAVV